MTLTANAKYLNSLSVEDKVFLLRKVATHYGVSVTEIESELTDEGAEDLYEYIGNDPHLRMKVYRHFQKVSLLSLLA